MSEKPPFNFDSLTRREHLALLAAGTLTACGGGSGGSSAGPITLPSPTPTATPTTTPTPAPTPTATPAASVHAVAAAKGRRFGSAVAWSSAGADAGSFANPNYAAMLERDCGVLVAENELKWEAIRPSATAYNFSRFDEMLAYAESKSMLMRGHTLFWYVEDRFPNWARGYSATAVPSVTDLVRGHVETVIRRYGNRVYSWDVVNEAIDPATGQLRSNSFSRLAGEDTSLIDLAFRTARAEAPNAQLVYNDYMDWGGGDAPRHRAGVLDLLRGFRARNVPVDALGIQGHIGFYSGQTATQVVDSRRADWIAFLDAVVALGYDLVITELDVNDSGRNGSIAVRDQDTATLVKGYLDIALSYRQCRDVLAWGMSDRYSWLQSFAPRSDGTPQRPCPYDRDFVAKPMRQAIIDAFEASPALTNAT